MRYHFAILLPLLASILAGCQTIAGSTPTVEDDLFVASDDPVRLGREHFSRGEYALAQRYYQTAVERKPSDGDAWIGLAASYDQLARFDLADRAYDQAIRLKGQTIQILNNQGYSYLLRGDTRRANTYFVRARSAAPGSQVIANNIELLRSAPR
jgi:Flp pilus assembly protein TadD